MDDDDDLIASQIFSGDDDDDTGSGMSAGGRGDATSDTFSEAASTSTARTDRSETEYSDTSESMISEVDVHIGGDRTYYPCGKSAWVPDSASPMCMFCGRRFSKVNRRHHCRLCGGLYCKLCSKGRIKLKNEKGKLKKHRICKVCTEKVSVGAPVELLHK